MESLDATFSKKCTHKAEAHIVVPIRRRVVVAISRPQVPSIVVPAAATDNAVRASFSH